MKKSDCIKIFNASIRGTPVSFNKELIPLISDYLTEIKYEKSDKLISLIISNPDLVQSALPKVIDYFCRKYQIFRLMFNNKIILYYE